MNNAKRESLYRVMAGLAVLIVIALITVAFTVLQNGQPATSEPTALEAAEPTEPAPTETPQPEPTSPPTPTAVPSPSPEPDLKFGIYPLQHSCDVYTKILARVLEEDLQLDIELVTYAGPAPLFADLADAQIDYTLCYAGLDDRQYLTEYVGFIEVYDNRFVEENDIWMQPVIAARNLSAIRNDRPCVHDLMGEFKFKLSDRYSTPNRWIEENADLARDWADCE